MHMAQLMPLLLTVFCSSKIQIGLPFWYRLTRVVPERRAIKRVCVIYGRGKWASQGIITQVGPNSGGLEQHFFNYNNYIMKRYTDTQKLIK